MRFSPSELLPGWPAAIREGRDGFDLDSSKGTAVQQSWQSTVIAFGFIAFAGLGLYLAVSNHRFSTIWSGIGTVVGVLTVAIPSDFFKQQADAAVRRATAFARALPAETYSALIRERPDLAQ
jgi:hypothetical protein